MNQKVYKVLESTKEKISGDLDPESQKYIDRQVLERKLDGKLFLIA
jgi:hypothetical protein